MVFSKVREKAMHSRLSQHLHTNNILVTEHMFLGKGYQLMMPLSDQQILLNLLFKSINRNMHVGGLFCE
jgi:hypothetical protein